MPNVNGCDVTFHDGYDSIAYKAFHDQFIETGYAISCDAYPEHIVAETYFNEDDDIVGKADSDYSDTNIFVYDPLSNEFSLA